MQNILSLPMQPINFKKFMRIFFASTFILFAAFAVLFTRGYSPAKTSVAPGRLGVPSFSHYIYGSLGDALNKPMFATFGNGRIYVSDTNNQRVQVFSEDGSPLLQFGERGDADGQFYYPYGIAIGPQGNIYVADMYRRDIQVFTQDGEFIRKFASESGHAGAIDGPGGMYLDKKGRLFIANVNKGNIAVFDIETETLLQTVGMEGDLFAPNDVTVDGDGYIYVVDTGGQRVIVYRPDGLRPVRIMNGSEDGRGQSLLVNPRGIGIRGDLVYVVSNLSHMIYVFDKSGKQIFTFGKQGEKINEFMHPNGLVIDDRGRMLITDTIGGRVAVY